MMTRKLKATSSELGPSDGLVLAVGPYFSDFGAPFQGELEQMTLTSELGSAELQCGQIVFFQVSLFPHLCQVHGCRIGSSVGQV